jgi:hypothetical protein
MKKEKVFELMIEDEDDISGIDSISLVDEPAIMVNWIAFKKEEMEDDGPCWKGYEQIGTKMLNGKEVPNCVPIKKENMENPDVSGLPPYVDELPKKKKKDDMFNQRFAADNEKHIVLGPAMVPDQKIFRKDEQGNPYYVFFSSETIKMIAEKYMRNKYIDNNDQMHDGRAVKDVYVIESWIKEDGDDKSNKYGFSDLPVGTWFVSMKINNPKIWDKVKMGELNGFSVSGYFQEVSKFSKEEMFLYKVAELLTDIKD